MTIEEYKYNHLEDNVFYITNELKRKGKEYGILRLNKKQINTLIISLDLMAVSPQISPFFSQKLENFISPRFLEINEIIFALKSLPDVLGIEFSKENQKEIIKAFDLPNVITVLKQKGYSPNDFINPLKSIQFAKYKY
ncbi:MAG: hypothetical protein ACFE8N_06465 [Promethearchaeota archaeon]